MGTATTRSPFAGELTATPVAPVTDLFAEVAARAPEAVAVRTGTESLTYRQIEHGSRRIARRLLADGRRPGDVVAVQGVSAGAIAALLGVLRAGCVVLPLDPALPTARRTVMLAAAGATCVLDGADLSPDDSTVDDLPALDGDAPAYVFFTSGSTAEPKGVLGRHVGLTHFVTWQRDRFGIGPGDRIAQLTNWSFDVMLREVVTPLVSGATICLPPSRSLDAGRVFGFLREHDVTVLHAVPSLARNWLADTAARHDVPTLRACLFAGEQLRSELVTAWRQRVNPSATVVNLYGPTETTLAKFCHVVEAQPPDGPQPVGEPLPGCDFAIVEPGGWEPRERGEVVLRTPYRSAGYLGVGDQGTFATIGPDVVYRTGDVGRLDAEGRLLLDGRLDDQVKVRGVRIDLGQVERVLAEHAGVERAVVLAADDELVAFVRGGDVTDAELRQSVTARLPMAAVPARFLRVPDFPLLPNGKLDRRALRALADEQPSRPVPDAAPVPDGLVGLVIGICTQVSGAGGIAPDDDLFERGVDSMAAMEIAARLEDAVGYEVPLATVFDCLTAAEIADRLALLATEVVDA